MLLIILFFADMALIGVYAALFYFIEQRNEDTVQLYTDIKNHSSDQDKIQELERTLKDTEKDRAKLNEYFQSMDAVKFIELVESLGRNAGVALSVGSVADAGKSDTGIVLDFTATGNFSNMYRLITLVESMPNKTVLKKISLTQKTDDAQKGEAMWTGHFILLIKGLAGTKGNTPVEQAGTAKTN